MGIILISFFFRFLLLLLNTLLATTFFGMGDMTPWDRGTNEGAARKRERGRRQRLYYLHTKINWKKQIEGWGISERKKKDSFEVAPTWIDVNDSFPKWTNSDKIWRSTAAGGKRRVDDGLNGRHSSRFIIHSSALKLSFQLFFVVFSFHFFSLQRKYRNSWLTDLFLHWPHSVDSGSSPWLCVCLFVHVVCHQSGTQRFFNCDWIHSFLTDKN